jgi:hypothetical protein
LITVVFDAPTPLFARTALLPLNIIEPVDLTVRVSLVPQVCTSVSAVVIVLRQVA